MFLTGGNGIQTSMLDTHWGAHTMLWHWRTLTFLMQQKILYGISKFLWKFPLLRGDYWRTDFQRSSTFKGAVSYRLQTLCVSGCGKDESSTNLFLHCDVFGLLWLHIRSWIGVYGANSQNISEHFHQFIHYTGHSKARRSFLQLLWLICVWLVWNERNNSLFNNIETPIDQLIEKVKYHYLWWLKANKTIFVHGFRIGGRTLYLVWVSTDLVL